MSLTNLTEFKKEVNLFEFSTKDQSYAVKSPSGEKSAKNAGIIGVRFIEEKEKYKPLIKYSYTKGPSFSDDYPWTSNLLTTYSVDSETQNSSSIRRLAANSFDMGTKFSNKTVEDKVTEVEFERGETVGEVSIYYASRKNLEKMGIQFTPQVKLEKPKAFKDSKYCKPPK